MVNEINKLELKKILRVKFTKLEFFVKVYYIKNKVIIYNDRDIILKYNIKLFHNIDYMVKKIISNVRNKIKQKYKVKNNMVSIIIPNYNNAKIKDTNPIGFFVQNKEHMNVYLYVHHNPKSIFNTEKTLFISFKGSSSIEDFKHDLKSAAFPDQLLSELNNAQNTQKIVNSNSSAQNKKKINQEKPAMDLLKH